MSPDTLPISRPTCCSTWASSWSVRTRSASRRARPSSRRRSSWPCPNSTACTRRSRAWIDSSTAKRSSARRSWRSAIPRRATSSRSCCRVARSASAGSPNVTTITPKAGGLFLASGDYLTDVRLLFERGISSGTKKYFAIYFPCGLVLPTWDLQGEARKYANIAITIGARKDMASGNVYDAPFKLESAKPCRNSPLTPPSNESKDCSPAAELRSAVAGQIEDFAGNVHDVLSITFEQHQGLMATHVANPDEPTSDEMTRVRARRAARAHAAEGPGS
jgi:hypothetical protein